MVLQEQREANSWVILIFKQERRRAENYWLSLQINYAEVF